MSASDQWSQNYTIIPLQAPEQLLRLRALYRFGARRTDRQQLLCEYPLVRKASGGGVVPGSTVNLYVAGAKPVCDACKKPDDKPPQSYTLECGSPDGNKAERVETVDYADPEFLKQPACVICAEGTKLVVNPNLQNDWAKFWNPAAQLPAREGPQAPQDGDISLGHYGDYDIYVKGDDSSQKHYNDFVTFALEAGLNSSSTGGFPGGSPGKTPQSPGAPALLQQPAAPQIMLQ